MKAPAGLTMSYREAVNRIPAVLLLLSECDGVKIAVDGTLVGVDADGGDGFSLQYLQGCVGGYIQVVGGPSDEDGWVLVMNEEGKLKALSVNPIATILGWAAGIAKDDVVVGPAVLIQRGMLR